jgi:hypothetical protein
MDAAYFAGFWLRHQRIGTRSTSNLFPARALAYASICAGTPYKATAPCESGSQARLRHDFAQVLESFSPQHDAGGASRRLAFGELLEEGASMERPSEQRASDEIVGLIRKLRWVGLESEAKSMERELMARAVPAADTVIATPRETD